MPPFLFYAYHIDAITYWNNHIINALVIGYHTIKLYNSLGMLIIVGDGLCHLAIP